MKIPNLELSKKASEERWNQQNPNGIVLHGTPINTFGNRDIEVEDKIDLVKKNTETLIQLFN